MGYDISDVGVVQRAKNDAEALGINAGIVPGHSKDAAGRLRRITTPSLESLRTAGVGMKTPPKVSLATARMLGLPTERIASPGTVGIDEHGLTPSRTMEERVRNLARIRAELKEFRRDLNDAAKVETGPYKDHAADANDAAFKREVSAANKEGDELKSRKAAAKLNVEKHRIDHERKVKALARENLEFEERVFREAEDERIRKEAEARRRAQGAGVQGSNGGRDAGHLRAIRRGAAQVPRTAKPIRAHRHLSRRGPTRGNKQTTTPTSRPKTHVGSKRGAKGRAR
jgi:hypothetical protein